MCTTPFEHDKIQLNTEPVAGGMHGAANTRLHDGPRHSPGRRAKRGQKSGHGGRCSLRARMRSVMLSPTSKPDGRPTRLSRTRVIPAKAGIQRCEGSAARLSQTHVIPAQAGIQRRTPRHSCESRNPEAGEGRAAQVMSVQGSGERPPIRQTSTRHVGRGRLQR